LILKAKIIVNRTGIEPALFTRLHPVAHLSTGRARGFRLVAKPFSQADLLKMMMRHLM